MRYLIKTIHLVALVVFGILIAADSHAQSFLTNGLIAYYPFNGNANDIAGTNNGVSYGATLTTDRFGNPNSAYFFNGSSSYIQTAHPMQDLTNATFSFWFNATKVGAGRVFLSDSDTAAGNDCNVQFVPAGNGYGIGVVASKHGAGSGTVITNGVGNFKQSISNNWLHFVWVMQPTNQQIYVNGVQVANAYATANDVGYHNSGFLIGASDSSSPYQGFFSGAISNMRIYNRYLSSNEVAQLYALESGQSLSLIKAVTLQDYNLAVGSNYQIQVSSDLINWTNQGFVFTATSSYWQSTNYWQVANWNQLFFRLIQQ